MTKSLKQIKKEAKELCLKTTYKGRPRKKENLIRSINRKKKIMKEKGK